MAIELPPGPLVSTEWLGAHLGDAGVRVVDIRGKVLPPSPGLVGIARYKPKRDEYEAGHVPGAVFVDWTKDIVDENDPVPVQIAPPAAFARAMEALGIGADTAVIAYDDYDTIFSGRLAWALRYYGHDRVRILDGGWVSWVKEGRPIARDVPKPVRQGHPLVPRARPAMRRTADEVQASIGKPGTLLVDARAPEQYAGSASAASRGGHVPGAKNVHYARLIDPATGRFHPREQLKQAFKDSGVDVDKLPADVVLYCNGGVSATVPMTALTLLGRSDTALYDGSWNEWGNDPRRPIE